MKNYLRGNPEALSEDDRPFNEVQATPTHIKGGEMLMGDTPDPQDAFFEGVIRTAGNIEQMLGVVISNNIRSNTIDGELDGAAGKTPTLNPSEAYLNAYNKAAAKRDAATAAVRLDQAVSSGMLKELTPEEGDKLYQELAQPASQDETYGKYYAALMGENQARWKAKHNTILMEEGITKTINASFQVSLTQARKGNMSGAMASLSQTLSDIKTMGDGGKGEEMLVENWTHLLGVMAADSPEKWDVFGQTKLSNGTRLKDSQYAVHYELGRLRAVQEREREAEQARRDREAEARRRMEIARLQAIVTQNQVAANSERGIESLILQGTPGAAILQGINTLKPHKDDPNYKVKQAAYSAACGTYNMYRTSMFEDPVGTIKTLCARAGLGAPSVLECNRIARGYGVPNHDMVMSKGAALRWSEIIRRDPGRGVPLFNQQFRGMESGAWKTLSRFSPQSQRAMIYSQMPVAVKNSIRQLVTAPESVTLDKNKLTKATTLVTNKGDSLFNTLRQAGMRPADILAYQKDLSTVVAHLSEQQGVPLREAVDTVVQGVTGEFVGRRFWTGATSTKLLIPKSVKVSQAQIDTGLRNFEYALTQGRLVTFCDRDGKPVNLDHRTYNKKLSDIYLNATVKVNSEGVHYLYNGVPLSTKMIVEADGTVSTGHEYGQPLSLNYEQIRSGELIWR